MTRGTRTSSWQVLEWRHITSVANPGSTLPIVPESRASRQWIISLRDVDLDEAARILIASGRLKWDTRSAIRWSCTTNVHTDKSCVLLGWASWAIHGLFKKLTDCGDAS